MVKLPQIQRGKIYILLAVLSWMGLLLVNLIRVFGEINQMEGVISKEITWVLEILFLYGYTSISMIQLRKMKIEILLILFGGPHPQV